jgi:hypothetical protein
MEVHRGSARIGRDQHAGHGDAWGQDRDRGRRPPRCVLLLAIHVYVLLRSEDSGRCGRASSGG